MIMKLAKLPSNSLVKSFAIFVLSLGGLLLESRSIVFSRMVFLGLPAAFTIVLSRDPLTRVLYFILFFQLLFMLVFWPVSVFSKSLVVTVVFWYLGEFPERPVANLGLGLVIIIITLLSAPVIQQF